MTFSAEKNCCHRSLCRDVVVKHEGSLAQYKDQAVSPQQGRNQDLNLAKQKYEILSGFKNCCYKFYKMTVYQAKTLEHDQSKNLGKADACLPYR